MERFTHLTPDATPVRLVSDNHRRREDVVYALVRTRTAATQEWPLADLTPLGSAEAQEILAEVTGQDESTALVETLEDRASMARWAKCVGNARDTLASGILKVLDSHHLGSVDRSTLEKALASALEDLADFAR